MIRNYSILFFCLWGSLTQFSFAQSRLCGPGGLFGGVLCPSTRANYDIFRNQSTSPFSGVSATSDLPYLINLEVSQDLNIKQKMNLYFSPAPEAGSREDIQGRLYDNQFLLEEFMKIKFRPPTWASCYAEDLDESKRLAEIAKAEAEKAFRSLSGQTDNYCLPLERASTRYRNAPQHVKNKATNCLSVYNALPPEEFITLMEQYQRAHMGHLNLEHRHSTLSREAGEFINGLGRLRQLQESDQLDASTDEYREIFNNALDYTARRQVHPDGRLGPAGPSFKDYYMAERATGSAAANRNSDFITLLSSAQRCDRVRCSSGSDSKSNPPEWMSLRDLQGPLIEWETNEEYFKDYTDEIGERYNYAKEMIRMGDISKEFSLLMFHMADCLSFTGSNKGFSDILANSKKGDLPFAGLACLEIPNHLEQLYELMTKERNLYQGTHSFAEYYTEVMAGDNFRNMGYGFDTVNHGTKVTKVLRSLDDFVRAERTGLEFFLELLQKRDVAADDFTKGVISGVGEIGGENLYDYFRVEAQRTIDNLDVTLQDSRHQAFLNHVYRLRDLRRKQALENKIREIDIYIDRLDRIGPTCDAVDEYSRWDSLLQMNCGVRSAGVLGHPGLFLPSKAELESYEKPALSHELEELRPRVGREIAALERLYEQEQELSDQYRAQMNLRAAMVTSVGERASAQNRYRPVNDRQRTVAEEVEHSLEFSVLNMDSDTTKLTAHGLYTSFANFHSDIGRIAEEAEANNLPQNIRDDIEYISNLTRDDVANIMTRNYNEQDKQQKFTLLWQIRGKMEGIISALETGRRGNGSRRILSAGELRAHQRALVRATDYMQYFAAVRNVDSGINQTVANLQQRHQALQTQIEAQRTRLRAARAEVQTRENRLREVMNPEEERQLAQLERDLASYEQEMAALVQRHGDEAFGTERYEAITRQINEKYIDLNGTRVLIRDRQELIAGTSYWDPRVRELDLRKIDEVLAGPDGNGDLTR